MSKLIVIRADWEPEMDFYELNPQIKLFPAFASMTSDEAWAMYFFTEPDENENKLFRLDPDNRQLAILGHYPHIDWERVKYFSDMYKTYCMSAAKRAYYDMKNTLIQRARFLIDTKYNESNVKILDAAHLNTKKIYDQYQEVEQSFIDEKDTARVRGGRKMSKAERKDI